MSKAKGMKNTVQEEETKRKPLFHIVVGVALFLLAVVLLLRGINGLRFNGFSVGVVINFLGVVLFSGVSGMMLSDLIRPLKEKSGKK